MHGRMARYAIQGDAHELARTAEEGMLPIFQSQPGFKAYSLLESGDEIISFSAWAEEYMASMEAALGEAYTEPATDVRGYIDYVKSQALQQA